MMTVRTAMVLSVLASAAAAANIEPEQPQFRDRIVMGGLMTKLRAGIQTACGCQIDGVSALRWSSYPDVSQWRIDWRGGTTEAQKSAAIEFMQTFDPAQNIEAPPQ